MRLVVAFFPHIHSTVRISIPYTPTLPAYSSRPTAARAHCHFQLELGFPGGAHTSTCTHSVLYTGYGDGVYCTRIASRRCSLVPDRHLYSSILPPYNAVSQIFFSAKVPGPENGLKGKVAGLTCFSTMIFQPLALLQVAQNPGTSHSRSAVGQQKQSDAQCGSLYIVSLFPSSFSVS